MSDEEQKRYQQKMEAELEKMQAEIQRLEADLKLKKIDARENAAERLQLLREQKEQYQRKLHELKTSGGAAWREARDGVARAWDDLKTAFQNAKKQL